MNSPRYATASLAASFLLFCTSSAILAQNIFVDGGAQQSNEESLVISGGVYVQGDDGFGTFSTYSANAPLTVGTVIYLSEFGVFNSNSDVTVGSVSVTYGTFNLNSGLLTVDNVSLESPYAWTQSGGIFDINTLLLQSGAAVTYSGSNVIRGSVANAGGQFTLEKDLSLTGPVFLSNGSRINRDGYTITASYFDVLWGSLTVQDGDSFAGDNSLGNGSNVSNSVATTYRSLLDGGVYTANAPLDVETNVTVQSTGRFTANANVTTGSTSAFTVQNGGRLGLNSNVLLTTGRLSLAGTAAITQNGGHYVANTVLLSTSASLVYTTADSLSESARITDGAALTLQRDLVLTGSVGAEGINARVVTGGHNVTLGGVLSVSATAAVVRSGSETITADRFSIGRGSSLTVRAGDSFAGQNDVLAGGSVTNTASTTYVDLDVSGTYSADAPLSIGSLVNVQPGGVFNANANVTTGSTGSFALQNEGTLNLNAGILATGTLSLTGSAVVAQNGGAYAIDVLSLAGGSTLSYNMGDSIASSVSILGAGSLLTANKALDLTSLLLGSDGHLTLASFSETWNDQPVAMQMQGDQTTSLTSYIESGLLTFANSPLPAVEVVYDAEADQTFVISTVPEPSACVTALASLACGGYLVRRRRTRSASRCSKTRSRS